MSPTQPNYPNDITLDDVHAVILIADENGEIIFANKAVKTVFQLDPEEVLGCGWWAVSTNTKEEAEERQQTMAKLARGELDLAPFNLLERSYKLPDNRLIWTQWTNSRLSGNRVMGIARDVTEKKLLRETLKSKNRENELLLQEVYHRVKNNLQIILSLLRIEFAEIDDERALKALKKSSSRIYSISLIHNELCNTNHIAHRNFLMYLENLLNQIFALYPCKAEVELKSHYACRSLSTEISVNLGLIITELVSNALVHAFNQQEKGIIWISLEEKNDQAITLEVKDNGSGIHNEFIPEDHGSLGYEIVTSLVDQIDGELAINSTEGTLVTINF